MNRIIQTIKSKKEKINDWLSSQEEPKELPLYSSVDVRDAGFKMAVVDTNLFPAGFNNLCEHGQADSVKYLKEAILDRVPHCRSILIVAEEHTRNTWYLENIRVLEDIIRQAGFNVMIATFLYVQPEFCNDVQSIELETATGQSLRIYCFQRILKEIKADIKHFDLIILNNDLSIGIPDVLKEAEIPIYPSAQAGWHSRYKSIHFRHTHELLGEFSKIVNLEPWFFSALSKVAEQININDDRDRQKLADMSSELFREIEAKYKEHGIKEKPYVVLKSDSGTYGMGVLPVEDPQEIIDLNRKNKNKLYKGKGAQVIERYLLQEGVPTIHKIDDEISEVCLYQIANHFAGAFFRSHPKKSARDNLNSQGMNFKKICPHPEQFLGCGTHCKELFDVYRTLGRIASIAAQREIVELETIK